MEHISSVMRFPLFLSQDEHQEKPDFNSFATSVSLSSVVSFDPVLFPITTSSFLSTFFAMSRVWLSFFFSRRLSASRRR